MTYAPRITCQADLEAVWRHLMQPLGFSGPSLWFMAVGPDDHAFPQLTQIEECVEVPSTEGFLGALGAMAAVVADTVPGARIAFLRSRPGQHGADADDRAWAGGLYAAARTLGVEIEVVHLATDLDVLPLPADAVCGRRS